MKQLCCKSTCPRRLLAGLYCLALLVLLGGCAPPVAQPAPQPVSATTLELFNWPDDIPQSVLDAFEAEYGVHVNYTTYDSMEEALERIRQGERFDVAVLDQDVVPVLKAEGLLARMEPANLPNLRNVAADFRNLAFDPENAYSIPYTWGTTGLIVRSDLLPRPVEHWLDLWDPALVGRVAVRNQSVEVIGMALLALGLPINTDDPADLAAAERKLLELHPVILDEADGSLAGPALLNGDTFVFLGWPEDAFSAREENPSITYVLPAEGVVLWQEMFAVAASSQAQSTAETFINFLLRADIGVQIIEHNHYASTNEAAILLADPELVSDPILYPPVELIRRSQWYEPISAETERLYNEIWQRFLAAERD